MAKRFTKRQRRKWWNSLSDEQRQSQIAKWTAKKNKMVKPERILAFNPKYPWMTEGVNDSNREAWIRTIKRKNPWLKIA